MITKNERTGQKRDFKPASIKTLERACSECVDRCTGACKCRIETDGVCPNGWPSRMRAQGFI